MAASLESRLCRAAGGTSCAELAEELGGVETAAEAAPVEEEEEEEEVVAGICLPGHGDGYRHKF